MTKPNIHPDDAIALLETMRTVFEETPEANYRGAAIEALNLGIWAIQTLLSQKEEN